MQILICRRGVAISLWKQLVKNNASDVFFFCEGQEDSAKRIIESHLKKTAQALPRTLFNIFKRFELILTPEEARLKAFKESPPCNDSLRDNHADTMHLLDAFIECNKEMHLFRKAFDFKDAPLDWIEVASTERPFRVLLDRHCLDPVVVHSKVAYSSCLEYQLFQSKSAKNPDQKYPDAACYCAALNITSLLTNELKGHPQGVIQSLCMSRQQLLSSIPRDFSLSGSILEWKTAASSLCNFEVVVWSGWRRRRALKYYREDSTLDPQLKESATEMEAQDKSLNETHPHGRFLNDREATEEFGRPC